MAAAIAITMYIEVPRIAFESQRAREQMAIDRGLQYKRAIQLFYRKYRTYPQTLDDLETTRNIRFLRHRYLDPLTGKEWRLLHVGSGWTAHRFAGPAPGSASWQQHRQRSEFGLRFVATSARRKLRVLRKPPVPPQPAELIPIRTIPTRSSPPIH